MPQSIHVHKSMLLRGLEMPKVVLECPDIEATRAKANSSGRSFGGAPLRGDRNGGGRGGRINYGGNDRSNPFAAHINPNFAPPPTFGRGGAPPAPGQFQGYGPPPPGYNAYHGGPPPPQAGSYNGNPAAAYGRPPGLPQGYQNGYSHGQHQPPPQSFSKTTGYYAPPPNSQHYRR